MMVTKYNTEIFNFKKYIQELYNFNELEDLHLLTPKDIEYSTIFEIGADSNTIFHNKFYERLNNGWNEFIDLYKFFVIDLVSKHDKLKFETIFFQKTPTFRVHLPNNVAVGKFHSDSEFNHPIGEVNYIIPITKMYGTNTIWCESHVDLSDYHPIPRLEFGDLFEFNGNQLKHGNLINKTNKTRISMDFRVISKKNYDNSKRNYSLTTKKRFEIGEYYEKL